jgi:hypothetical protein
MTQTVESLDFSKKSEQAHTISPQPVPESMPQPLADWLTRILARIRAAENQPNP